MRDDPFAMIGWRRRSLARWRRWLLTARAAGQPPRRRRRSGPPNLLVIAIDTLRFDHLGLAGGAGAVTPALDALATRGVAFTDVTAPAPWTLPSFTSSLTGVMPCLHGAAMAGQQRNLDRERPGALPNRLPTLARHLAACGYRTAAIYANPFVRFGLAESFAEHRYANLPAHELAFLAGDWLRRHAGSPFFCFLLLNDPHEPTVPPRRFLRPRLAALADRGLRPSREQLLALARWGDPLRGTPHLGQQEPPLSPLAERYAELKLALYAAAVSAADDAVGALLASLERWDLAGQTLVTVYSDHGEEFLDHLADGRRWAHDPRGVYGIGHGHTLFQELLHVPWLVAGPGVPPGVTSPQPASLCDVAPTLCAWLGAPPLPLAATEEGLVGRSLTGDLGHGPTAGAATGAGDDIGTTPGARREAAASNSDAGRLLVSEDIAYGPDLVAVRRGRWKLIAHRTGPPLALYDLVADPRERRDVSRREPQLVADLSAALARWRDAAGKARTPRDRGGNGGHGGSDWTDVSDQVQSQLRELGYLD